MNEMVAVNRDEALGVIRTFLPLFRLLNKEGTPYCIVGGLGVMINSLAQSYECFRLTEDVDIMFSEDYTNADFARTYLAAYASDPKTGKLVYEAVFGGGSFEELETGEQCFINTSFIGADKRYDGMDTPNVDVVRRLDEETLDTLESNIVTIDGVNVTVATPETLLRMKRYTMQLLTGTYHSDPRPQDIIDVSRLEDMEAR